MQEKPVVGRIIVVLALLLVSLFVVTSLIAAPAQIYEVTDGQQTGEGAAEDEVSHRLIVQLDSPALAEVAAADRVPRLESGRPDFNAPETQSYVEQLQSEQAAFLSEMQQVLPEAAVATYLNEFGQSVEATYQIVFNGVAVDPGQTTPEQARRVLQRMDGVKAVFRDYARDPQLYASLDLINAPTLWSESGTREDAGAGVKVASMDGGLHHDAPMFDGTGFTPPTGYPRGDTANTNGKIIVSRAYFRDWDPPAPGDENTWPGENGTSHGVHTGSTAMGNVVTATYAGADVGEISGVAPGAYAMSYRVFYYSVTGDGSFYPVEGIAALEDIVADDADVLNNSWGGGPGSAGGEFDPLDQALINASNAGVFVSMSNGNAGPGEGTGDHPSDAYINVAASTTDGTYGVGRLNIVAPSPVPTDLLELPFEGATFGGNLAAGQTFSYTIKTAASVDPANVEGCNPWPAGTFEGTMAVISRGSCFFSDKVYYAEQAGADVALIYNNDGDGLISMACGGEFCDPGEITIPSFFVGQTDGEAIVDWYEDHGDASVAELDYNAFFVGNTPDVIANFSSRGPGVGNVLKPDIAAPGVNIIAQGFTPAATGEDRHLGYGQVSGTSIAAPHVAGSAALLRELHPTWTNAEIKSALMSTSQYMDIYNADGSPAQPLDMGAGRLDLTNAADPGVFLSPPSLSFGQIPTGTQKLISVTVTSASNVTETETYELSTLYTGSGFGVTQTTSVPGLSVSPDVITLTPGGSAVFTATFDSTTSMGLGDNQGYVVLAGDNGHEAHMPAWARVLPPPAADVLVIDNDFSFLLGIPDYRSYYLDALDELGLTYDVWHADAFFNNATTVPDAATLSAYEAILYFSGDNFYPDGSFTVATPLTSLDMNRLNEYANDGGIVIAMGQDATWVMNDSFFAASTLGAQRIQDSVTGFTLPDRAVIPMTDAPEEFEDVVLDLSGPDTYVGQIEMPDSAPASAFQTYLPAIVGGSGPALPPPPTGSASFSYLPDSNHLDYSVTISATAPVTLTASHIHDGNYFESGPVLYPLFSGPEYVTDTFTFEGTVVIDEADEAALLSGDLYVNVHSTARPAGAVRGQVLLAATNDGANNQFFIDELEARPNAAPNPVRGQVYPYQSLLYYPDPDVVQEGSVAIAHRDQPSLERPGTSFFGRTIFTGFGLEGVNDTGMTTSRAQLLQHFLDWAMDEPQVSITDVTGDYVTTTSQTVLSATFTSNISGTTGVSYRWDFGDGSDFTVPYSSNVVSHDYDSCGPFTVRVEAVDSWGNHAIGSEEITVVNCP